MTYTNKDRIITIKYFLNNKGLDVPRGIDKMQKNALNAIILEQEIDMEEMLPLAKGTYVKRENKNLIVKSKVETLTQKERDMFNDEIEKVVKRQLNMFGNNPLVTNTLIEDTKKNLTKFIVKNKFQDKLNDIIEKRPKPKWKQLEATYEPAISVWRIPYEWDEKDIDCDGDKVYYKGEEVDVKQVEKDSECVMTMNRFKIVPYDHVYERIDSEDESDTSSVTYESEGSKI
jgi:hypothetical protein